MGIFLGDHKILNVGGMPDIPLFFFQGGGGGKQKMLGQSLGVKKT